VKPRHRYGVVAAWCVAFFVLVPGMCAQQTTAPTHNGFPQDWSQHQLVFSRDGLVQHPELLDREPRLLQQAMQRWQVPDWGAFHGEDPFPVPAIKKTRFNRDWNVATLGAHLRINMFPAKFSFNPAAPPDCVKDFVVFGLAIAGVTTGQANLVAFNNLYVNDAGTGACPGTSPNLLFAYNISTAGGKILTSPTLSLDGSQIAFVESVPGMPGPAIFHVLTWTAGAGAIGDAAAPASMTSLTYAPTAGNTTSSPWVDYGSDTVYVGADNGIVYQITNAFTANPVLTGLPNWPVTVSANYHLTSPVLDTGRGLLFVGSNNGNVYQVATATGIVGTPLIVGQAASTTSGVAAPPIVDITNGTIFAVSPNNGTSAVLVEADSTTMIPLATASLGIGSAGGTKLHLFQPAFSHAYYNSSPPTGIVSLCGTGTGTDTSPWQYEFSFSGTRVMNTNPVATQLSTSTTDRCTGWTEFFNPNIGHAPGTDFFFFGLTGDCETLLFGNSTAGCVVAIGTNHISTSYITSDEVEAGPSGIVIDNYSTALGASSIYLTSLMVDTAFQFSQSDLD